MLRLPMKLQGNHIEVKDGHRRCNGVGQNRTEQNRTEQNRTEQRHVRPVQPTTLGVKRNIQRGGEIAGSPLEAW